MPIQKPGKSKQDYQTPPEFLTALKKRLHIPQFGWDLAATKENSVAPNYITEEMNSLDQHISWCCGPNWSFLNPPFGNLTPWIQKAWHECNEGAQIAMLVPASVGANWWIWVHNDAHVLFLNGRLTFVGEKDCYPKDCAILLWTPYMHGGYEPWTWREQR